MTDGNVDEHLDELIDKARDTYHVAPEPPLEAMWASIEPELPAEVPDIAPRRGRGSHWSVVGYAAAAALVLGIGVGRWTATRPSAGEIAAATAETNEMTRPIADVGGPLQRSTTNYLGQAEALLASLQRGSNGSNGANGTYASQAAVLLMQTRLLLDSPAAGDARLRDLLEDLELALLQIAALKGVDNSERRAEELQFIRNALDAREMVPRLRTAVVTLASYED